MREFIFSRLRTLPVLPHFIKAPTPYFACEKTQVSSTSVLSSLRRQQDGARTKRVHLLGHGRWLACHLQRPQSDSLPPPFLSAPHPSIPTGWRKLQNSLPCLVLFEKKQREGNGAGFELLRKDSFFHKREKKHLFGGGIFRR